MPFTIFQNEKTPFQAIKTRHLKIDIFAKALTHGFGPEMAIFPSFFFRQFTPRKCLLRYSRIKKTRFQAIKRKSLKSYKIYIFAKGLTHGFRPKMAIFSTFFQVIQAKKMSFTIFQNGKTPFQDIKTKGPKSPKFNIFQKALTQGFGPKMAIFPTFSFQAIQGKKMSFTIFQNKKTPLYCIKKTRSKSPKIDIFPKGKK